MFHANGPSFFELAVQALSSTERGYDLLAPKFDYTPFRTPDVILDKVAQHLAPLGPFGSGLDVCCGTGAAMRMLRPAGRIGPCLRSFISSNVGTIQVVGLVKALSQAARHSG